MAKTSKPSKAKTVAQLKKEARTPTYKTSGSVSASVEERLRFYLQKLPQELHAVRASLMPFDDIIQGGHCGDDDIAVLGDYGTGKPYFMVQTADPNNTMNEWEIVVTASAVFAVLAMHDGEGGCEYDEPVKLTLAGLYDFLRQLPRGAHAFEAR